MQRDELELCAFIDSWSTSPRIFTPDPNPGIEQLSRAFTNGMFNRAILLSQILRAQTQTDFNRACSHAGNFEDWPNLIDTIQFDPIESRNGCEVWRAFLTVAKLASCLDNRLTTQIHDVADPVLTGNIKDYCYSISFWAKICAHKCLVLRYPFPLTTNMQQDMHLVIQILEVELYYSPYAVQCLNQAIRLASTSYDQLCKAKQIITDSLSDIRHSGVLVHNQTLLEDAETYLQRYITDVNQRIFDLAEHIQSLPDDLQEHIMNLMKQSLKPLDPPFRPL